MSANLHLDEQTIRTIVEDVMRGLGRAPASAATPVVAHAGPSAPSVAARRGGPRFGVFEDVAEACAAAQDAFEQLKTKGIAGRAKVVEIVKTLSGDRAAEWGKFEFEETKIGRLEHKIEKLQIVKLVPGVEWIKPYGMSGDHGITLEEYTPFGVIGAILPVTHSVPTLSGNIINIVAAGNAVVFNPHPGGARSAALAVRAYNEAIHAALGIENLVCTVEKPTLDTFSALTKDEHIRLLCVTGGPAVVAAPYEDGMGKLVQGALESSNVNVVQELVDMIETQRAYEVNSKMIQATDEMMRNANQQL